MLACLGVVALCVSTSFHCSTSMATTLEGAYVCLQSLGCREERSDVAVIVSGCWGLAEGVGAHAGNIRRMCDFTSSQIWG